MRRKRDSKAKRLKALFPKKRLILIGLLFTLMLFVVNFKDTIFFAYPEIVGQYRMRYNEMNTGTYLEKLRAYANEILYDSFEGLDYRQLVFWIHNHLLYWSGALQVRPEMPIEILSTNILGTVRMKNGGLHYAIYCSATETYVVFLAEGETIDDVEPNSWVSLSLALGRCGEFALLYNGLLLANNYRSRIVVDCSIATGNRKAGDHVWNEVLINGMWLHVDPTERIFNSPDLYSNPNKWNKEVNKVYAIEGNIVVDVTQTYARS